MAFKLPGVRPLAVVAVGVLAGSLLTMGGSAVASSSSAGAEIHACVHKKTRYARIVNVTTVCKPTEIRVKWAQSAGGGSQSFATAGPQGPQGPVGRTGATGPTGPTGSPGRTGFRGKNGIQGPAGPIGPKGVDGKDGVQGPVGPKGADGTDGKVGPEGPAGPKGAEGTDGKIGPEGPAGPKGANGTDGKDGKDGAPGTKGANGEQGPRGLQGPKGDTGAQGPKGEPGSGKGGTLSVHTETASLGSSGGTATCDSDEVATGGGFFISDDDYVASASMPSGNGWSVKINKLPSGGDNNRNSVNSGGGSKGTVYVVCAKKS
ncbi:hypothetical protein [Streptosporangium subroseum]|uniref:hypothetical protein n=1 Tax=Streptosporangium subroseum TaxID=106412 RepID=UPI00308BD0F8|nr:hypothetical protein OHB15_00780 [Streptosporangium subroseum]